MKKVYITKTLNADTRSMNELDYNKIFLDTSNHIYDVKATMTAVGEEFKTRAGNHDWTKLKYFDKFFEDLSTKKTGAEFKALDWWQLHRKERHHLNDRVPIDVDLLDVIEMATDVVCAGKARTGEVWPLELSDELLQKALHNTIELLKTNVCVKNER